MTDNAHMVTNPSGTEIAIKFDQAYLEIQKKAEHLEETTGKFKRIVEGYAAVAEVVDEQHEVITREALEKAAADLLYYTTVLYNHDKDRPIGRILEAEPRGNGLYVKVLISEIEDEIWQKIVEGIISKFSIRGVVTDFEEVFSKEHRKYIKVIKGFRIHEISLVTVPANPHARTLHYYLSKALEESIQEVGREVEQVPTTETVKPNEGGLKKAMDKERANFIAGLVDKLMAALQDMPHKVDERLLAICRRIKSEVLMAASEGNENYPQPYPQPSEDMKDILGWDPTMENLKNRISKMEEDIAAIKTSVDEVGPTLEAKFMEAVKSLLSEVVEEKYTTLKKEIDAQAEVLASFIELFDALRPHLGLPTKEAPKDNTEEVNPDA